MLNSESHPQTLTSRQDPEDAHHGVSSVDFDRPVRTDSRKLMQGARELLIAHAGEEYRLRLTRNDKLILTK